MTTRRQKLAAMAAQSVSPEEAAIAAVKLASTPRESWEIAFADPEEHERLAAWLDIKQHERLAELLEARRAAEERAILVRRWERGTFSGMTFRAGAAGAGREL